MKRLPTSALIGICALLLVLLIDMLVIPRALSGQQTIADGGHLTSSVPASEVGAFPSGIVSINFDDGWKSGYTVGFPILEAASTSATFYIVSHYLGDHAYMTVSDMLALQAAGDEIGDHTSDHPNLTRLSLSQMEAQIAGSISELKADGVSSITTFAYPYGAYNTRTDTLVRQAGYVAARTVNYGSNAPAGDPYHLLARDVTKNTTVAEVEEWIAAAVAKKEWLILVFHELNIASSTGSRYSWPAPDFQTILEYLKENQVPVMTNAAVVNEYYAR